MGLEPTTTAATVRRSAIELQAPSKIKLQETNYSFLKLE
tara:strand:- start:2304 stop:2420 length:117 start_codon:yes stop_codon:yes gene_type:complete